MTRGMFRVPTVPTDYHWNHGVSGCFWAAPMANYDGPQCQVWHLEGVKLSLGLGDFHPSLAGSVEWKRSETIDGVLHDFFQAFLQGGAPKIAKLVYNSRVYS